MSLVSEAKAAIDTDITNKDEDYTISPEDVGNNMKAVVDVCLNPVGSIIMYHPSGLTEFDSSGLGIADNVMGWAICNGNNDTPDLQGKFIAGYDPGDADYNTIGETGGAKTVTLTANQIPPVPFEYNRPLKTNDSDRGVGNSSLWSIDQEETVSANTINASVQAHENRPPYYVLVYLKRIN